MFIIDNITIVLSIVLLLLTTATLIMDPFVRYKASRRMLLFKPSDEATEEQSDDTEVSSMAISLPKLSVILTPHDQAEALGKTLPLLLHQDYPVGYQVIVVSEESDHATDDVLKRNLHDLNVDPSDATLYVTSIQDSSRFMSRKKLAVTLGVKAAHTDWLLFTEADCQPQDDHWLRHMSSYCDEDTHMVIGYAAYADDAKLYQRFERILTAYYLFREDEQATAYRAHCPLLMMRKDDFMKGGGYLGNLHLIYGEYDFLVNKYAVTGHTSVAIAPAAWIIEEAPSHRTWTNRRLYYQETRRFLNRSLSHRILFNTDQLLLHLAFWADIGMMVYAGLTRRSVLLTMAIVTWITLMVVRSIIGRKAVAVFDKGIGVGNIFWLEMAVVWHNAWTMLRHHTADKMEFTTHKQ